MPTLEEVAELAGVSRSTVSRVVNNNSNVKSETRERVMDVISELNFSPNAAARSLAGGKTGIFGLVIPMGVYRLFTEPFFPILIQTVSHTCNQREISVMLWLAEPEFERRMINQILTNDLIDGVIVSSMRIGDPIVDALSVSNMPFILIGRHPTDLSVSYVDVDNILASRRVVSHLLGNGRRRIATITGNQDMIVGQDRLEGYRQALNMAGISAEPELEIEGFFTQDGGYQAMRNLLDKNVDAIFAASDSMALGAIKAIQDAGLRVPDDIAVVGFEDAPFAVDTNPPLTTVRQPTDKLGSYAVEMLVELIESSDGSSRRMILPAELVIRASS